MTNNVDETVRSNAMGWLVWLLRIDGALLLCAIPFIFVPFSIMANIHNWLGLEELNETPLLNYLTRSLSLLYAMHGAVVLYASYDVVRNWHLIRFLAVTTLGLGIVLMWVDISAGMQWWWFICEGPPITLFGVWILAIQGHIQRLGLLTAI